MIQRTMQIVIAAFMIGCMHGCAVNKVEIENATDTNLDVFLQFGWVKKPLGQAEMFNVSIDADTVWSTGDARWGERVWSLHTPRTRYFFGRVRQEDSDWVGFRTVDPDVARIVFYVKDEKLRYRGVDTDGKPAELASTDPVRPWSAKEY